MLKHSGVIERVVEIVTLKFEVFWLFGQGFRVYIDTRDL
jgi:hypothetical protein